jgi:hypothetical protein
VQVEQVAFLVGATATVLGAVMSVLLGRVAELKVGPISVIKVASELPRRKAMMALDDGGIALGSAIATESAVRLPELREVLRRQESTAKWSGWANNLLTFGQFVVGGVLASSLVQAYLSPQLVGLIGLIVLMSSLVRQTYRPDLVTAAAGQRSAKLRALVRELEDDLFAVQQGQPGAPSVLSIRQRASAGLAMVDGPEVSEAVPAEAPKPSPK